METSMTTKDGLYQSYIQILKEELMPAMGCTEPIALAYASAQAREVLGEIPQKVIAQVSSNIVKNVKSVVVPTTGGRKGIATAIAAGIAVLLVVTGHVTEGLYDLLNSVLDFGMSGAYFTVAFKALGICVVTGFIADLCRDAGQSALASRAELAGRCAVFILSLPLLNSLLETARKIIG